MGSHYIPVGKIKIDKEILDIVCPAAGYGETPPPPQIYCPANNFFPEYETYTPPIDVPNPENDNEIILLCDDIWPSYVGLKGSGGTSSNWKIDVYDENQNFINTQLVPVSYYSFINFYFPTQDTGNKYILKITPETEGQPISNFNVGSQEASHAPLLRVFQAIFNTPQIEIFTIVKIKNFKSFLYKSTLNNVTSFSFTESGLTTFIFPDEMLSLTSLSMSFKLCTDLEYVEFAHCLVPNLSTLSSTFESTESLIRMIFPEDLPNITTMHRVLSKSGVKKVVFPKNFPLLQNFSYVLEDCMKCKEVELPLSFPETLQLITGAFENCGIEGELIVPEIPNATQAQRLFIEMKNVLKIKMLGTMNVTTQNLTWFFGLNPSLQEFEFPRELINNTGFQYIFSSCPSIRKVKLPDKVNTLSQSYLSYANVNPNLEEVTGDAETPLPDPFGIAYTNTYNLRIWDTPKLKLSIGLLRIGRNGSPLETFNIDWANSVFTTGIYLSGQLTAAKIDAIFTALPPVSGTEYIDIKYNPGAASCTPSIATAKGWTVINTV